MPKIYINGDEFEASENDTVLTAVQKFGGYIPTLCYLNLKDINIENKPSSCRVCMVEIEGRKSLAPACTTPVSEGLRINTLSRQAVEARRTAIQLLLSDHPQDCLQCPKNGECDLQRIASELNIVKNPFTGKTTNYKQDISKAIIRDPNKCIMCRRCETMCNDFQTVGVLSAVNRGFNAVIKPTFDLPLEETACTFCGQCVAVCPTGALEEDSYIDYVWKDLVNEKKHVVVQTAPAVRVALAEEFGFEPGTISTGKLVGALKLLGFDKVFDTNFGADLTIIEEATEFKERLENDGFLPMLTSCCPGWIKFLEHQFPDLIEMPSSAKSPQQMFGAIVKSFYAQKANLDPKDITVVSIMPCLAKKYEASRKEINSSPDYKDVDYVLTTRELAKMIKEAGINFTTVPERAYDNPLGESTGAAAIFGRTGGVAEAALRTTYEWLTGKELKTVEFQALHGYESLRVAEVEINGQIIKIGVAYGLGNARKLLEAIRNKKIDLHLIEIMACPGGCVGGGGQPYHHGNFEVIKKRIDALNVIDRTKVIRKSHENPYILRLYNEYLEKPGSDKAHKLLHTHYLEREWL
ncbi:MAG: NADH-dependent [FeFe] hydrogenase, group A6 [Defluviitoga tunisiensis]|jgi:NADH-quinone oxidoreductase subunit G|uniref:Iron only hydrogenase large subunit, C-terminal domain n=1 Tax=Defluviitoga tunisiensis TaxID=1006576 RepID=A0A0C7NNP4_DEFTU|nr:NADH-dependent [FeFe] hydrogenase, group A6 [Defluviitoga tunisiensis]MDD3601202.1 NADH-dependent [FeFe] hydrogenase, group A6 [Defluviitoga tunisiensis]MDY0379818.1 NADH-dependent [FeFe] hydrogenase, group A6 [Defluviitoga tunisiensis]CEP77547.1 Iron only hydrogenase large subunit, C-terminal domain [Defluviitoga tunisiensis]HHV01435.1 4Fe-4S binding protein [Defluviitoga tunisiensis]HOB55873.1 NADH-dependent [FeFe] hydrogenase, group A6 [Defluviitoga tunisiensis]